MNKLQDGNEFELYFYFDRLRTLSRYAALHLRNMEFSLENVETIIKNGGFDLTRLIQHSAITFLQKLQLNQ